MYVKNAYREYIYFMRHYNYSNISEVKFTTHLKHLEFKTPREVNG